MSAAKEQDPLLPATANVGDGNRSGELEDDASGEEDGSGEEDEHREENEGCADTTISWDDPSLYTISSAPDASMAGTVGPAGFADASLQLTGPFYSEVRVLHAVTPTM